MKSNNLCEFYISSTRMIIKIAFRLLKRRWRILLKWAYMPQVFTKLGHCFVGSTQFMHYRWRWIWHGLIERAHKMMQNEANYVFGNSYEMYMFCVVESVITEMRNLDDLHIKSKIETKINEETKQVTKQSKKEQKINGKDNIMW